MLDALCFALFGKPFRSINKPQLVNSINGKDCVVEVSLDTNNKNYRIVRGIKPNVFEIYCNGELINQEAASRDYQELLEKYILKLNYKSFTQIVILIVLIVKLTLHLDEAILLIYEFIIILNLIPH